MLQYKSTFKPHSIIAQHVLNNGKILGINETPAQMIDRILEQVYKIEVDIFEQDDEKANQFVSKLGYLMDSSAIVFSTPILTNLGRLEDKPLSACTMPNVKQAYSYQQLKEIIDKCHQDGMGTGFNLSSFDNPLKTLKILNEIALDGSLNGKEDRPVGNMAILDVDSPFIMEFIDIKKYADEENKIWKFNISVNIDDMFMDCVVQDKKYILKNGQVLKAREIMTKIAESAHKCGDPGLVSMDRFNKDNPTPNVGFYETIAPCAETGLVPGETCVFGYINLNKFIKQDLCVDYLKLDDTVHILVRALDNILELSIKNYLFDINKSVMTKKRKIGIGVCGFADMLISMNIRYGSIESQKLIQEILNFVNYKSKIYSIELARERGSFVDIENSRYIKDNYITKKFINNISPNITRQDWIHLEKLIKEEKLLRHCSTTCLPPTGRSALVISASTGIEPLFNLDHLSKSEKCSNAAVIATDLCPNDHIEMVKVMIPFIDESISKTINLPENTTVNEIFDMYIKAYKAGLKGISLYRDKSRSYQPKKL